MHVCSKLKESTSEITFLVPLSIYLSLALDKKWSLLLRVSAENVTQYPVSFIFGHIYWRNP